jgi:hypothetical protein
MDRSWAHYDFHVMKLRKEIAELHGGINGLRKEVNWTSTKAPRWREICAELVQDGGCFELRDIKTKEEREFVLKLAALYKRSVAHGDGKAQFWRKDTK